MITINELQDTNLGYKNAMEMIENTIKNDDSYSFLKTNEHLGDNIILLTVGGSYAYGTFHEGSDIDIRGCATNSAKNIYMNNRFEQIKDTATDTVIYSFDKFISYLLNCNPNIIEMLGCNDYFILSDVGKELIDNSDMFLSKLAVKAFAGYAGDQLYKLKSKTNMHVSQAEKEKYILNTINNAEASMKEHYQDMPDDAIKLYVDTAVNEDMTEEIFMDISLNHYPLRDYAKLWNDMKTMVNSFNQLGKRNKHAIEHDKIGKHMMHLIRLYAMGIDILEKRRIITYREDEHDLLMDIRNNVYIGDNGFPTDAFWDVLSDYEARFAEAKAKTSLPDKPDYERINSFLYNGNKKICERG